MPTQEALPQECGFGENEKGNCKLSKERSGMDNCSLRKLFSSRDWVQGINMWV